MRKGTNLTNYSLTQNFRDIERIYKISFSKPIDNGMQQFFKYNNYMELFTTILAYFIAV